MSFKLQTEFLAGILVIFAYCKLSSEILGFLNHILIDDLNVCLDSRNTRILDESPLKLINGLIPPPRGHHKNASKTNEE